MAPPNNPQVLKVAFVYQHDTRQFVNVIHLQSAVPWTLVLLSQIADDAAAWWHTYLAPCINASVALSMVQVRQLNPVVPLAFDKFLSPPDPGTRAGGSPLPGSVTLSAGLRTGLAGRKYRGRLYLPGLGEGDVSDTDLVSSVLMNAIGTAMVNLIAYAWHNTARPVVFHKADNTFTDIISTAFDNIVDSQRRRLPGRGR